MRSLRPTCLTLLAATLVATAWVARADTTTAPPAAPPTTQPLRTIAAVGTAEADYQSNVEGARKKAITTAYDAALADAKQNAERGTKVLGVRLGAPVTVDAPSFGERQARSASGETRLHFVTIESSVRIVFELVP